MSETVKNVQAPSGPWWKYGHMWLVLGGPAAVIVAGIATFIIAHSAPDPVISQDEVQKTVQGQSGLQTPDRTLAPAQALRNHAATPDGDLPNLQPKGE